MQNTVVLIWFIVESLFLPFPSLQNSTIVALTGHYSRGGQLTLSMLVQH